jgi:hypothetical protein
MSTALAIGAVTAVLKGLLNNGLIDPILTTSVGDVLVSALPPDRIPTGDAVEQNQLNLFLYQVSPNQGWRNFDLPSRNAQGQRISNPPLALDLHFLLSAYGALELHAEILLGYGMHILHETPFLTRDMIRSTLNGSNVPANIQALGTSGLADQVEQVKICPYSLTTEEISRFWTAFQTHYRPTAVYQVSVVLIESLSSFKPSLPVRESRLQVVQLKRPSIYSVSPQIITVGGQLTIQGQNLSGNVVQVNFGTEAVNPNSASDTQIVVTAPADLLAGVNTVQVVQGINFGTTSDPHPGFESNIAAFILIPAITTPAPYAVSRGSTLTLSVSPPVGQEQKVVLLVGDRAIAIPARPVPGPATTTSLDFPFPTDFPTGTFLLRLQIDGAESALTVDANNQYNGPMVTVS